MSNTNRDDRILPETRWVAALVIPFLVVAFIILYIYPGSTERLFAWKLQPAMSARMLGAAYAGGIYFFTQVLIANRWHRVKVGFLPVTTFAALLGIATILHWDRFNHGHIAFFAWAGLYFTAPIIVFMVWLRNRARDPLRADPNEVILPGPARLVMGIGGAGTLLIGLILFLKPDVMFGIWPWTLTPLTARVMGAMFCLPAVVGLGVAWDKRWSVAKNILQSQSFSILLILVAASLARGDFDWMKPGAWIFVIGLSMMLVGILSLYALMELRRTLPSAAIPVAKD